MKTRKKYLNVFLIGSILMLSLIGVVNAIEITTQDVVEDVVNSPPDNWLGRIISQIKFSIFKVGTFTVYGDELGCAKYPTQQNTFKKGNKLILTAEPGEAGFVNWFRGSPYDGAYSGHPEDSRQFMGEEYIEYGEEYNSVSWICDAGAYWDRDCYYDFYSCPFPCYSDSDCSSGEFCDKSVLSQKIPNAGVCKVSTPTHTTKVYRCENGEKEDVGEVSHGDVNFCTDSSDSKYLIGTTDQCLPYEPKICYEKPEVIEDGIEKRTKSITYEKISLTPSSDLKEVVCDGKGQCPSNSSCVIITSLIDKEYLVKDQIKQTRKDFCKDGFGYGTWTLKAFTDGDYFNTCEKLTGKDKFFQTHYGFCISGEEEKGEVCDFLEPIAFFKITGDDCTDGGIITVGVLLLFIIIFSRMTGVYGKIKYEI